MNAGMKTVKLVWNSATLILFQASAQHQTDCFQHTQRTGQSAQKVLFTSWPRSLGVLFSPPGATKVTTVVIWTALLQLCIISVFHATSLLSLKDGQGVFDMCNDLKAFSAHEGKTGTDESTVPYRRESNCPILNLCSALCVHVHVCVCVCVCVRPSWQKNNLSLERLNCPMRWNTLLSFLMLTTFLVKPQSLREGP